MAVGKVMLVGAGPGDAGLLTLRGKRALAKADAIVLDHLAPARLLRYARPDAEVYDVGKQAGHHPVPQREIEALMIRLVRAGKTVVRLKGGDPFVFGRGGEEALALSAAGIPWEVVPGVTSAVAVPAYAGIPLTHRGVAPAFTVMTGHQCAQMLPEPAASGAIADAHPGDQASGRVDWAGLAKSGGTLVILMGVGKLSLIAERLITAGRSPDTPAAAIQWGTRAAQRTVKARLADLPGAVRAAGVTPPAVIVVGDVAALPDVLAWFERQPLFGRRIIVIGESEDQTLEDVEALEALGAEGVDLPLAPYAVRFPEAAAEWAASALRAAEGHGASGGHGRLVWWFRTPLGVAAVWQALLSAGADARALAGVHLVAEGAETAAALARFGLQADVTVEAGSPPDAALPAGPAIVWKEAPDADPRSHGGRVGAVRADRGRECGVAIQVELRRLWQPDIAALRARLERLLADVEDPAIHLVWAHSTSVAAIWRDIGETWHGAAASVPVYIGRSLEAAVAHMDAGAVARAGGATSAHPAGGLLSRHAGDRVRLRGVAGT
jgi:uroporphyrinogen III methyltransferase/synthase